MNRKKTMILAITLIMAFGTVQAQLPRIGTRSGVPFAEFYNTRTGQTFKPVGSSYVRLYDGGKGKFHSAFAVGLYEPERADEALRKMAESGYNVVRVWCFYGHFGLNPFLSIEGPADTDTPELYQLYVNNLMDFLERATKYKIYVQLAIDRTPQNNFYKRMVNNGFPKVEGSMNREYMVPDAIAAKEIYIDKLIQSIIDYDPNLLSTIFAYEIRNEIHSESDKGPFNSTFGKVKTAAGKYDMGNAVSRQACQDENISLYLNRCVAKIKQKDPKALTTSSIFTFLPVKKDGMAGNGLLPLNMKDNRWPVRPNVLLNTDLDFVDIHCYIPYDWNKALESSQWSMIDKTKKPFMAGEFGAHRKDYANVSDAAEALYQYRKNIFDSGFQGALLFTWDTTEHTRWTMTEDGEIIKKRLKP